MASGNGISGLLNFWGSMLPDPSPLATRASGARLPCLPTHQISSYGHEHRGTMLHDVVPLGQGLREQWINPGFWGGEGKHVPRNLMLVHPTGFHWFVPSPARAVATCKKGSNGGRTCSDLVNAEVPSARAIFTACGQKNTKMYIDFHPTRKIECSRELRNSANCPCWNFPGSLFLNTRPILYQIFGSTNNVIYVSKCTLWAVFVQQPRLHRDFSRAHAKKIR